MTRKQTLISILLAGLMALVAFSGAGTTVAQTAGTLISNKDQRHDGDYALSERDVAQKFTTGANTHGYVLTGVALEFNAVADGTVNYPVSIHTDGETWQPGELVTTLTPPSSLVFGTNTWTSPGVYLAPNTTYTVVLDSSSDAVNRVSQTFSDDLDSSTAAGWSLDINSNRRDRTSTGTWGANNFAIRLQIKGFSRVNNTPNSPTSPLVNSDPANPTTLSLSWLAPDLFVNQAPISSYDVRYRATNTTTWRDGPQGQTITSATITGLTENTIYEVQVRANNVSGDDKWSSDWSSPGYGVAGGPPQRFMVGNTGQANEFTANVNLSTHDIFQPFTTGTDASSYRVTAIDLLFLTVAAGGETTVPDVRIYTDLNGAPNTGVGELFTKPVRLVGANFGVNTWTSPGVVLQPGTTYHLGVLGVDSAHIVRNSSATAEDGSGLAGWSVGDSQKQRTRGGTDFSTVNKSLKLRFWGDATINPDASDTLVGNTGQPVANATLRVRGKELAQTFYTGANSQGYILTGITLRYNLVTAASPHTLSIYTYSAGVPDQLVAALTRPASLTSGLNTWTTPGIHLQPSTSYVLSIDGKNITGNSDRTSLLLTDSDDEDSGAAAGWSMTPSIRNRSSTTAPWSIDQRSLLFQVKGFALNRRVNTPTTPLVAPDPASPTTLPVSWRAPDFFAVNQPITSYDVRYRATGSATWDSGPRDRTVTSATITGLTGGTAYEVQVRATSSAGDSGWSASGYGTAGGPAQGFMVGNSAQANEFTDNGNLSTHDIFQPFTTTTDAIRFRVTAIDLVFLSVVSGGETTVPDVGIYLDAGGGRPGALVGELFTRPVRLVEANYGTNTWTSPGVELAPGTNYVLGVLSGAGAAHVVRNTSSASEDAGALAGWSVGDSHQRRARGTSSFSPVTSKSLKMRFFGDTTIDVNAPRPVGQLVSNTGIGLSLSEVNLGLHDYAQRFTTGANTHGYTLTKVTIGYSEVVDGTVTHTAGIYAARDSNQYPGQLIATLTPPASLTAGLNNWTTPGIHLAPNSRYFVVIDSGDSSLSDYVAVAAGDDEDPGGAEGWSIREAGNRDSHRIPGWTNTGVMRLRLDGFARRTSAPSTPTTPRVNSVADTPTSLAASWLAPDTLVNESVSGYDVRYRVQGSTGGWSDGPQDVTSTSAMITGLAEGTDYEVQVRASIGSNDSDWSASGYGEAGGPVQGFMVGNTAQAKEFTDNGNVSTHDIFQPFTTGTEAVTYRVTSIDLLFLHVALGSDRPPLVGIYQDRGSGLPGNRVGALFTRPARLVAANDGVNTWTSPGVELEPGTTYILGVTGIGSGGHIASNTPSTAEDAGGMAGWSVSDSHHRRPRGTSSYAPVSKSLKMRFYGDSTTDIYATPRGTLVSNAGQSQASQVDMNDNDAAQSFRTGSSSHGYVLTSVAFQFSAVANASVSYTAGIYTAHSDGKPNQLVAALDAPSSLTANSLNAWTSSGIYLAPDTDYVVLIEGSSGGANQLSITDSDTEDTGGAAGWTVGDGYNSRSVGATEFGSSDRSVRMQVSGYARRTSAPTPPTTPWVNPDPANPTTLRLSWLAPDTPVNLSASYDVRYRATGSDQWNDGPQDRTTTSATITGLTDGTAYEVQVQVSVGTNDSDWSASGYGTAGGQAQILVVGNTAKANEFTDNGNVSTHDIFQPFTTGTDAAGFQVTAIDLLFHTVGVGSHKPPRAGIYRDRGNGLPGDRVGELFTAPVRLIAANDGVNTWTSPGVELEPGTKYVLGVFGFDNASPHIVYNTPNASEDGGGLYGWTVSDSHHRRPRGTASYIPVGKSLKMRLWGSASIDPHASRPTRRLVSNTGQAGDPLIYNHLGGYHMGQRFTTGGHTHGYTLTSADIRFAGLADTSAAYTVSIYTDSGNAPDQLVGHLNGPSTLAAGKLNTWTSPGIYLAPNTEYVLWIDASDTGTATNALRTTQSDNEDSGGFAGWSIFGFHIQQCRSSPDCTYASVGNPIQIQLGGFARRTSAPTPPTTPRVSSVADTPTSLSLSWLAPDTLGSPSITGYDVRYRVQGSTGGWSDGPQNVTRASATITGLTEGTDYEVQVRASVGSNDSDWSASGYGEAGGPVQGFVVGNSAQPREFHDNGNLSTHDIFQPFTTGSSREGYRVTAIDLLFQQVAAGTETAVSHVGIYQHRGNGLPGAQVGALFTRPARLVAANYGVNTWTSPGVELEPDTTYILAVTGVGSGGHIVSNTPSTAEDAGGLDGWSVSDTHHRRTRGGSSYSPVSKSLKMRFWGYAEPGNPPVFASASYTLSVAENTAADTNIGEAITATDADGDTLTYILSGTGSDNFKIDSSTGQISTKSGGSYDYEVENSYELKIIATDGLSAASATVTITVTDVDTEAPGKPAPPTVSAISTTSLTVSWTAPDNGGPAINDYDVQYREGASGNWNGHPHSGTTTTTTISNLKTNANYQVRVRATGPEGTSEWSDPAPGSTNTVDNAAPVFGATGYSFTLAENADGSTTPVSVGTVSATDADAGNTVTYSITAGNTGSVFAIDGSSGAITYTGDGEDFEDYMTPASAFSLTVQASDGAATASVPVTVAVTDVNETPVVSGDAAVSYAENGTGDVATYTASDPEGAARIYWTLSGVDVRHFSITDGVLKFTVTPDYESPADADADNVYSVTVRASDGTKSTTHTVAVTVTDVNETPVVSGDAAVSYAENGTGSVGTYTASDPENATISWSLAGADAADFSISDGGVLAFAATPDYESPADADANNVYTITVLASDGANTDDQAVTVTVTNVVEVPSAPDAPTAVSGDSTTSLTVTWTAPANTGPAINGYDVRYRAGTSGDWTPHDHTGTDTTTTIGSLAAGASYQVQVRAKNAEGDSAWSDIGTGGTNTPANNAPAFDADAYDRSVPENTGANQNVGTPVTATDADSDTLTYSLSGSGSGDFTINASTGQIRTKSGVTYDHEQTSSYSLSIVASDSVASDTATVNISVSDVDEPPVAPGKPEVEGSLANPTDLTVTWDAPANVGKPAITSYDLRYSADSGGTWDDGPQDQAGLSATIGSLTAGTSYEVQVRATNEEGDSGWSASGSGIAGQPDSQALLSTTGQDDTGYNNLTNYDIAQQFTTGAISEGYTVTSVDLEFFTVFGDTSFTRVPRLSIREVKQNGKPGTRVGDPLTAPTRLTANSINTFKAAAGIDLAANTTYFLLVDSDHSGTRQIRTTTSDNEDTLTPLTGWSAENTFLRRPRARTNESQWESHDETLQLVINGYARGSSANSAPEFALDDYTRSVAENSAAGTNVGDPVTADDSDTNDTLAYTLEGTEAVNFTIEETTGQIKTKAGVTYNHEAKSNYTVIVRATDLSGDSDTTEVTIQISDVDTEAPSAPAAPTVEAASTTSLSVSWTAPANTGPAISDYDVQYRKGTSGDWTAHDHTGTGTSTTIGSLEAGESYQVQVKAKNAEGDSPWSASGEGSTNAVDGISELSFGSGTVADQSFTQNTQITPLTLPEATGGDGALTYSLIGPDGEALPAGLSFNASTRVLSGTPTGTQECKTYIYQVTDEAAEPDSDALTFGITVSAAGADLAPSFCGRSVADQIYTQDTQILELTLPEAVGGDGTLNYSLTPTPPTGLTFDPATRVLSGTPTAAQEATTYTYKVTDGDNTSPDSDTLTFGITVVSSGSDRTPTFGTQTVPDQTYTQNVAVDVTLPVGGGGDGSLSYDLTPQLPSGLSFDGTTRKITGTPTGTQAAATYTYKVTDSDATSPDSDTLTFSIAVVTEGTPVSVALVSNAAQADLGTTSLGSYDVAQGFTTGDASDGYRLTGVDIDFGAVGDAAAAYGVGIYSADGEGNPGTLVGTALTGPSSLAADSLNSFTSSDGVALDSDTTYFVHIDSSGAASNEISTTLSNYEDAGSLTGWSISDDGLSRNRDGSGSWSESTSAYKIRVKGYAVPSAPVFDPDSVTRTISEDIAAGPQRVGAPVSATDPNGDTLSYTIAGVDATDFSIVSGTGQIWTWIGVTFDYETKSSYSVTVTAWDDDGHTDTATVTIDIDDVNETPVVSGDAAVSYAENGTGDIATYTAADPESATITWSLAGTDAADFSISGGALSFSATPDHERPADSNTDNIYSVTVQASDGTNTGSLDVTVTVTDVDTEVPGAPAAPTVEAASTTSLSVSWSAPANTGPAISDYDVQYRKGASGDWTAHDHTGTGTSTTIGSLDASQSYQVQVKARNAEGDSPWSASGAGSTSATAAAVKVTGIKVGAEDTAGQLKVSWDRSTGATGYKVQWKSGDQDWDATGRQRTISSGDTLNTTFTGLTAGAEYSYRVIATKTGVADAAPSDVAKGTVLHPAPAAPTNVAATPIAPAVSVGPFAQLRFLVTWTPSTDAGVTKYEIAYEYGSGNEGKKEITSGELSSQIIDTGNPTATSYTVKVRAIKPGAASGESSSVMVTTIAGDTAGEVTGVSATSTKASEVTVSWTAVADAGGYKVFWTRLSGSPEAPEFIASAPKVVDSGSTTTATLTSANGIVGGDKYRVWVLATETGKPDSAPGTSSSADATALVPLTGLSVAPVDGEPRQLAVSWSAVSNATGYVVRWKQAAHRVYGYKATHAITGSPPATTYTITQLEPSTAYDVKVTAIVRGSAENPDGAGDEAQGTTGNAEQLETTQHPFELSTLLVYWNPSSEPGVTGYLIQWKGTGQDYSTTERYHIAGPEETSYRLDLPDADTYTVRVTQQGGTSDGTSSEVSKTVHGWFDVWVDPSPGSANAVHVEWEEVSNAAGFVIWWALDGSAFNDTDKASVTVSNLKYHTYGGEERLPYHEITGLRPDTRYRARVAAYTAAGSAASPDGLQNENVGSTHSEITGLTVSPVDGSTTELAVSWGLGTSVNAPEVTGYVVQWKTGTDEYGDTDRAEVTSGTSHRITGLTANTGYSVRVTAQANYYGSKEDGDSAEGTATTNAATSNPSVNGAPVFGADSYSRSFDENTAAGTAVGAAVSATDADGDSLTYTLGGTDANSFTISASTGQISTKSGVAYDHESKSSYTVTVTASDGTASDSATVNISVNDVNETPTVSGSAAVSYAENGTGSVATYTAADPENGTITWSLAGTDAADFSISDGGVLSFSATPDYENPADSDADNVYSVTVRASDGTNTGSRAVTVTVTDVNETPTVSGSTAVSYAENGTGSVATYSAADPENATISWSLAGTDEGDFSISDGGVLSFSATPDYENPADSDNDNVYSVTVRASDGTNTGSRAVTVTVTDVQETASTPNPGGLSGSVESAAVVLTWTPGSDSSITGQRVMRRVRGQDFVVVAELGAGAATYTDNTVVSGTRYFYRIESWNGSKALGVSNRIRVIVP